MKSEDMNERTSTYSSHVYFVFLPSSLSLKTSWKACCGKSCTESWKMWKVRVMWGKDKHNKWKGAALFDTGKELFNSRGCHLHLRGRVELFPARIFYKCLWSSTVSAFEYIRSTLYVLSQLT